MTRAPAIVGTVVVLALFASCAGGGRDMDPRGAKLLHAEISEARTQAEQGNTLRAIELLHSIDATVNSLRARDWISDRRAAAVLAALGDVEDALVPAVTSTTTTTTATNTPPPPAPRKHHGHHNDDGDG